MRLALVGIWGGIGACIGATVDALIVRSRPIYQAPGRRPRTVTVVPLLLAGQRGILVSLSR